MEKLFLQDQPVPLIALAKGITEKWHRHPIMNYLCQTSPGETKRKSDTFEPTITSPGLMKLCHWKETQIK
ncbi:hypothetical protein [Marinilabilia rubra]|uniref:Uncharacterized protein n=1 Tax=Marinilabilia rubra TaxID=2162893 RepID=A0A2U2BEC8_9BACT|nr:hypothetical protein [Marinilabilia rubra]PWE01435.1 hypothetical protein DDZ16_02820 [Marinilabilia rubra]